MQNPTAYNQHKVQFYLWIHQNVFYASSYQIPEKKSETNINFFYDSFVIYYNSKKGTLKLIFERHSELGKMRKKIKI